MVCISGAYMFIKTILKEHADYNLGACKAATAQAIRGIFYERIKSSNFVF